ncbi:hypothetical protein O3M35_000693 [Rhynocoris fuscipes]|uniref:Uncharacterized protein n=1 Tax=Rhynocoris fuscipes TaxID=488301 RepID=A0AAW1DMN4_9HEMI
MLLTRDENVSNTIEVDIINAETESPDMYVNAVSDSNHFTPRVYKPSSIVTVTLFIIVGLLAFIFTVLFRGKKRNKVMQCVVDVKSCYINYGSTNIQLPQFMTQLSDIYEKPSLNNIFKQYKTTDKQNHKMILSNERQHLYGSSKKPITMVSDLWKAKSQQSNNFFIINIIPEEDENQDGNV